MRRGRAGRAGFTLLELLVALVIAGIVFLGARAVVAVAVDVGSRERDRAREALRVESVQGVLRRWLSSATLLTGEGEGYGFEGRDTTLSGGLPGDEVAFVTLDPAGLRSELGETPVRVRLRVAPGEGGEGGGLGADYAAVDDPEATGTVTLLPEVRGLDVRYLVNVFDRPQWFGTWSAKMRLPLVVELRLYAAARSGAAALGAPLWIALPRRE